MLGNPPEQENPDQDKNAALMPIAGPQQISLEPLPPAPLEVNPTNPAKTVPKPDTLVGIAMKTDHVNKPATTDD